MQSFKPAVLFGALLFTGMLAAQTPEPTQAPNPTPAPNPSQAPAAPAKAPTKAAPAYAPNPGQGGVPTDYSSPATTKTREQQEADVKAEAAHMAELQVNAFALRLNLTPPQIARLRPILADRQKQLRGLVVAEGEEASPGAAERRDKAQKVQEETESRIMAILTPTQKSQYERFIALHRAERSRRDAAIEANRRARLGLPPAATAAGAAAAPAGPGAPPAPAAPPQPK